MPLNMSRDVMTPEAELGPCHHSGPPVNVYLKLHTDQSTININSESGCKEAFAYQNFTNDFRFKILN